VQATIVQQELVKAGLEAVVEVVGDTVTVNPLGLLQVC
jgi:hypothetical protein